jgi:hypothetical protein
VLCYLTRKNIHVRLNGLKAIHLYCALEEMLIYMCSSDLDFMWLEAHDGTYIRGKALWMGMEQGK